MQTFEQINSGREEADVTDGTVKGEGEECIQVHHMTSAVAFVYEKLRTFVDYKDEHLLRKSAVYRILKRRFIEGERFFQIAEGLIKELISAHYLPNNEIPESKIGEVAEVIKKYNHLFAMVKELHGLKDALKVYDWIMGLAACEIERILVPAHKDVVLVRFLYNEFNKRLEIVDDAMSDKDKDLQLYLGANRCFIKSDKQMLDFLVVSLFYPAWMTGQYDPFTKEFAETIFDIRR